MTIAFANERIEKVLSAATRPDEKIGRLFDLYRTRNSRSEREAIVMALAARVVGDGAMRERVTADRRAA